MAGTGGTPKPHAQKGHHQSQMGTVGTGMPLSQIAIVVLIVVVVGGAGIWYLNRKGEDSKLNIAFKSSEVRKISTSNGQRGNMTLSDSTTLAIGPATSVTIIPDYNDAYRGIQVDGTVAFDVKYSPNTPLEVRAGGAAVVMDSGSLVVRDYSDEGDGIIYLKSGTALVRAKDVRRQVTAPARLAIGRDSTLTEADSAAADLATSWSTGTVQIKDMPLGDVLKLFTKYYALTMKADDALLTRPVTLEANLDSKQKAIDALEASAAVKFGYDGSQPVLRDNPKAKKK